ncbi:hypothetical protein Anapl_11285 [Anas platyrhynchos]|uniref:Uncharacterized protein n=1 Tax=Anas platyrhynchos TaxID=8839 RepID=R0JQP1_ANAPL|nr:hypothetical protein Anapl_11285 [Anas platyrhynchos]
MSYKYTMGMVNSQLPLLLHGTSASQSLQTGSARCQRGKRCTNTGPEQLAGLFLLGNHPSSVCPHGPVKAERAPPCAREEEMFRLPSILVGAAALLLAQPNRKKKFHGVERAKEVSLVPEPSGPGVANLLATAQQENPLHGLPVAPSHWDLWGNRGRERWGLKGTVKPPCVQEQDMLKHQLRDMQRGGKVTELLWDSPPDRDMLNPSIQPTSEASLLLMNLIALAVSAETPSACWCQRVLSLLMVTMTWKRFACFQTAVLQCQNLPMSLSAPGAVLPKGQMEEEDSARQT